MENGGCTLYIGILVDLAIGGMILCSLGVLNDVGLAGVIVEMYRWLSMLKPGKEMITADERFWSPTCPANRSLQAPTNAKPGASIGRLHISIRRSFEKQLSQALSISMEDQANRPHRKAKAKKKHTGGKKVLTPRRATVY